MFLVTGASGNVGREVVATLQDKGAPVRALHRSRRDELPAGVEVVRGDLNDPDSLAGAFDDVEGVFLLPGYADMPGLVRLAERSGARIILLSGPSADSRDLSNAVTAYMVRSEDAVRAGDVPWTILRPSGFMSNTFQWVHQLSSGDVVTLPFAGVPIAWIDPADIAAVAALALTEPGHDRATTVLRPTATTATSTATRTTSRRPRVPLARGRTGGVTDGCGVAGTEELIRSRVSTRSPSRAGCGSWAAGWRRSSYAGS